VFTDLDLTDVVDGTVVDDVCADFGMPYCPGPDMPATWMPDPFCADVNNTTRLVYLHDVCADQRAQDI
jgi:hypothetical protein